jgi:hypothetical protein
VAVLRGDGDRGHAVALGSVHVRVGGNQGGDTAVVALEGGGGGSAIE